MPKTKAQKAATVAELTKEFKSAKSVAFANYQGITVAQADELRKNARASNVHYLVAKKSLITRAAKDAGFEINAKEFPGMIGTAFGTEDEMAPAKILGDLAKKTKITLVGGIFEGLVVPADKVVALSKLPGKKELLAMFVGTLNGIPGAFVRALNAIVEKQGAPAAEEPKVEAPVEEAKVEAPAAETPAAPVEAPKVEEAAPAAEAPVAEVKVEGRQTAEEAKPEGDAPAA